MWRGWMGAVGLVCALGFVSSGSQAQELPDIRTVPVDLVVPQLSSGAPHTGQRVKATHPEWQGTKVYHVLHLPENWQRSGKQFPVVVELAGNGGYHNPWGDSCDGRPEGCKLGYGLGGGRDYIWLCLPYLNAAGDELALQWWGDAPTYDPQPTLAYMRAAVEGVCQEFQGDPQRVVLCGFSRGAIATNYLGLNDAATSGLWCGFFAYSHYDGVRGWPFPDSNRAAAAVRLERLQGRPQFICSEGNGVETTRQYLTMPKVASEVQLKNLTFTSTGFRNHNDAWILRPSPARTAAREWLQTITGVSRAP